MQVRTLTLEGHLTTLIFKSYSVNLIVCLDSRVFKPLKALLCMHVIALQPVAVVVFNL